MGNFSELDLLTRRLRNPAAVINETADTLAGMFGGETADAPAEPPLTLEQVRAVLAEKSRAGHTAEIRALLKKYGADRLSAIDSSDYKALLADAEELSDAE